jgi:hypothetical protein
VGSRPSPRGVGSTRVVTPARVVGRPQTLPAAPVARQIPIATRLNERQSGQPLLNHSPSVRSATQNRSGITEPARVRPLVAGITPNPTAPRRYRQTSPLIVDGTRQGNSRHSEQTGWTPRRPAFAKLAYAPGGQRPVSSSNPEGDSPAAEQQPLPKLVGPVARRSYSSRPLSVIQAIASRLPRLLFDGKRPGGMVSSIAREIDRTPPLRLSSPTTAKLTTLPVPSPPKPLEPLNTAKEAVTQPAVSKRYSPFFHAGVK